MSVTYTLTTGEIMLVRAIGIVVLFAVLVGALLLQWSDEDDSPS